MNGRVVMAAAAATLATTLSVGCAPYTLRGKVVEGDVSFIAVVDASDPRLDGPGLSGALLTLQTDPQRLNRKTVGSAVSGADGSFSIPVNEVGAGLLIYDMGLKARKQGYSPTEQFFRLPPANKRVLVLLAPGAATTTGDRSTEPDAEELLRRFRPPRGDAPPP
ncbi:MAG: hypothetical protein D6824_01455 [Planctomycetota bacterium]|nr:MAG: hypothetical protein D6824_01455 [Planctomycetota bacterium]